MGVEINIDYQGHLRCHCEHGPSHATITTDAPKDNHGKGESFSPTDLVATALGSCMMTIMGIAATTHGYQIEGSSVHVVKDMIQQPTRRIGQLRVVFCIQNGSQLREKDRKILEQAAHTCPVYRSLHPDIKVSVVFNWQ